MRALRAVTPILGLVATGCAASPPGDPAPTSAANGLITEATSHGTPGGATLTFAVGPSGEALVWSPRRTAFGATASLTLELVDRDGYRTPIAGIDADRNVYQASVGTRIVAWVELAQDDDAEAVLGIADRETGQVTRFPVSDLGGPIWDRTVVGDVVVILGGPGLGTLLDEETVHTIIRSFTVLPGPTIEVAPGEDITTMSGDLADADRLRTPRRCGKSVVGSIPDDDQWRVAEYDASTSARTHTYLESDRVLRVLQVTPTAIVAHAGMSDAIYVIDRATGASAPLEDLGQWCLPPQVAGDYLLWNTVQPGASADDPGVSPGCVTHVGRLP